MNIMCNYCYCIVGLNDCNKCDKYDYNIIYHCINCHKTALQKANSVIPIKKTDKCIEKIHIYLQPLGTYITPYGRKLLPCKR